MKDITYKEIFESLYDLSLSHSYMSDIDKFGQLDIYDWNKKEYKIIDNHIKPEHKKIYQDCETYSIRCILSLIDLYGEDIKPNLKLMIGSWNGVGHAFFTFIAKNKYNIEEEFLWDNNLPCPIPLNIILLQDNYQINYIYKLDTKDFFKFNNSNELLNQLSDYNNVPINKIKTIKQSRNILG